MSATGRGAERVVNDFYPTPQACADACVGLLTIPRDARVLEPSAGSGNFVGAIRELHGVVADAVDFDPQHEPELRARGCTRVHIGSFLRYGLKDRTQRDYDFVIGNPPYDDAARHIRHAMFVLRPGGVLAMLLRSGLLHPAVRRDLRLDHPPVAIFGLQERPPFRENDAGDGETDATEYAWFVWRRGYRGPTVTDWFSWKDPVAAAVDRLRIRSLDVFTASAR